MNERLEKLALREIIALTNRAEEDFLELCRTYNIIDMPKRDTCANRAFSAIGRIREWAEAIQEART